MITKYVLIFLLSICMIESTTLDRSRCRPGDVKVDSCGNLCRCFADGVQTSCTKIFCPAFEKIPKSPDMNTLWDSIFNIDRNAGRLFKVPKKEKLRA